MKKIDNSNGKRGVAYTNTIFVNNSNRTEFHGG